MSLVELLDPSFVKDCLKNVSDSTSPPDSSPPPRGTLVHGFDGTYARRIKTDAAGELQVDVLSTANPPNLDRSLLTVKRELLTFAPASGQGAAFPIDDYDHWEDPTERAVTELSWTEKTRLWLRPRNLPARAYGIYFRVQGYVSAGQTMYVRLRSWYRGELIRFTFTETTYTWRSTNASYLAYMWWDDPLLVEAYVTGGTGYIRKVGIDFIKCNSVEGWTGVNGPGEQFKPLRIDADGSLLVKTV